MSTPHRFRLAPTGRGLVWASFLCVGLLLEPTYALAGGYDIPVINTAKHGGMGGTAIAYVEGGTSLYLNPAGLGRIGTGNIDRIGLHIGAGYRVTFGRLDRKRPDPLTALNLVMKGVNYKGFRVGFEWQLTDYLSIGAVNRNKITVGISQNGGSALNAEPQQRVWLVGPMADSLGR